MNKILKNRGMGKTTDLIRISAEKQYPIVVHASFMVRHVMEYAKNMGLNIPTPLVAGKDSIRGLNTPVLVDEASLVLRSLLGCEINTLTMSIDD